MIVNQGTVETVKEKQLAGEPLEGLGRSHFGCRAVWAFERLFLFTPLADHYFEAL
jgi:hypothetical protein